MTTPDPRIEAVSVPVQLTRMEGKFDLVIQRLDDLIPRVTRLEGQMVEFQTTTQRLDLEATARDQKAVALALALKEAKETQEADAQQPWTPVQRLGWFVGAALVLVQLYQYIPGK
jgi:hypothetical protein